ncbi:MBL fold metallo-hydrolase [Microbacterium sp. B2969]|uniref:MBL fold metallo-hydrolase n=1 Tax=Microbacterium alkaliflavum TaxID=3248839 RepID=A0ABW7QB06_9MICO
MRRLEQVADGVLVATSRVMSTTSTVLAAGGRALLVDPAWMPDELGGLDAELRRRELRVVGGFATHAHHDHLLWHPGFGDAPRCASPQTVRLAESDRGALVEALGGDLPPELADLMGRVMPSPADVFESPAGPVELIVHDGHAPGHTALWLPVQRVLIAGDMLSDLEVPLPFDPDDVPAYLAALDLLEPFAALAAVVIPGHGAPGPHARARLDADRRYLDAVLRGRVPDDDRLADPGMRDEYEHLVRVVRGQR